LWFWLLRVRVPSATPFAFSVGGGDGRANVWPALISSARKSPSNLRPEVKISFGVAVLSAGSCRKNLSIEKCRWDYTTAMPYKGPLRILKNETLSADESKVEERFAATVQENLEGIIAEYHARFGNVIDTDRAREFSQDYCASNESKTRFSRASYNPAKALVDEIYRRKIESGFYAGSGRILFTSGGTGAGKSSALAMVKDEANPDQKYDLLVDGTLSDYWAARSKILNALSRGHEVAIFHFHREFAQTVKMVIKRAIDMGRAVTLDNIAATHFRSAETLFKLAEEFGIKSTFE
jgi:hypothetical protein